MRDLQRGRSGAALAVAVGLVPLVLCLAWRHAPGAPQEEGAPIVYATQLDHGLLPWRDYATIYGPVPPFLLRATFVVGGTSVGAERALAALLVAALASVVTLLGLPRGRTVAAAAGTTAGLVVVPIAWYLNAELVALVLALLALHLLTTSAPTPVVAGVALGVAFAFRPDNLPALFVASAIAAPHLWRRIALGAAAPVFAVALAALLAGPSRMVAIGQDMLAAHDVRGLPVPPLLRSSTGQWLLVAFAGPAVALSIAVRASRAGSPGARRLAAVGGLSGIFGIYALSRPDDYHVLIAAAPAGGLLVMSLAGLTAPRLQAIAAVLVAAVLLVAVGRASVASPLETRLRIVAGSASAISYPVRSAGRSFPLGDQQTAADAQCAVDLVGRLSATGDRLWVGPARLDRTVYGDTFFYFVLPHLRPATYFVEITPGELDRRRSSVTADLRRAQVLLLSRRYDAWDEPNDSSERDTPWLASLVRERYRLRGRFGPFDVLTPASRTDAPARPPDGRCPRGSG